MVSMVVQPCVSLANRLDNSSLSLSTMDLLIEHQSIDIMADGWLEDD